MPDTTPIWILYAEDAQFLREYVSKRLRASEYTVVDAPSGDEAFAALLGGADADILLTDINMPGTLDARAAVPRSPPAPCGGLCEQRTTGSRRAGGRQPLRPEAV
jgi:CheY-like chemotaxis protein